MTKIRQLHKLKYRFAKRTHKECLTRYFLKEDGMILTDIKYIMRPIFKIKVNIAQMICRPDFSRAIVGYAEWGPTVKIKDYSKSKLKECI